MVGGVIDRNTVFELGRTALKRSLPIDR